MKKGKVEKIASTKLRNGGYAYRIIIDGNNYGCGFDKPDVEEGDLVEFNTIKDGKFYKIEEGTLRKINLGDNNSTLNNSENSDQKQLYIVRQNCVGNAIKTMQNDTELSIDDVILKADLLVDYVFNGLPEHLEAEKEKKMLEEIMNSEVEDSDPLED